MMTFTHLHFAEPRWLWLAVFGPLLLLLLQRYSARARQAQLARVASAHFLGELTRSHSPVRRVVKEIILLFVVAAMGLALARPQWGEHPLVEQQLAGEDIMFVLDCSKSMWSTDVAPNRFERARLALLDFVRHRCGGRVGLVAFSGGAFLQCPLTFDYGVFADALMDVDDQTISVPGTDIGLALAESVKTMDQNSRHKVVVLLTDGEDLERGGVDTAVKLAKAGVVIYTIGVGTPAGSEIPVVNAQGQGELVRDKDGAVVRSRLDETTLRDIARATGGNYFPLGPLGEGLARVRIAVNEMTARSDAAHANKLGVDRFHFPLALALTGLVVESLLTTRRRKAKL